MSASHAGALSAIAFQLLASLDEYAAETRQFTVGGVDPEAYHRLRLRLDEMRGFALAMPPLSVAWVELLIRHFELAHARWKLEQGAEELDVLGPIMRVHQDALQSLRSGCETILRQDGRLGP
jgi:hypothetical protein